MNRRNFTKTTVLAGMGISKSSLLLNNNGIKTGYKYNLHYAPHIGMFKNHASMDKQNIFSPTPIMIVY